MILHYAVGSPHSAAVRIALAEKGVEAEERRVDLARFAQHTPDFLALGSGGTVPVLEDGEQVITGSFAQMLFLEDAYPATPLAGTDEAVRDLVREWAAFVEAEIAPNLAVIRWQALGGKVPSSALPGIERLPSARKDLWRDAAAGFAADRLENAAQALVAAGRRMARALEQDAWLAGAEFTFADIAMFPHVAQFPALGLPVPTPVAQWLERVSTRPSIQAVAKDLFPLATMGPVVGRAM